MEEEDLKRQLIWIENEVEALGEELVNEAQGFTTTSRKKYMNLLLETKSLIKGRLKELVEITMKPYNNKNS